MYNGKILRLSCTTEKSTCPQVGASCYPSFWQRYTCAFFDEQKGLLNSQLNSDFWDSVTFFEAATYPKAQVAPPRAYLGLLMHT
jgi:hypothetical protein